MRRIQFKEENFYHVFNRGVDKRQVFMDDHDFLRFYVSLYAFNDAQYIAGRYRGLDVAQILQTSRSLTTGSPTDIRERMVDIVAFCLLGNHFHLLLRQRIENGVSDFLKMITQGYTRYFNMRYERSGALFQGTFKAVAVSRDSQLMHLPRYIHLNALDFSMPEWRTGKVVNWDRAITLLSEYRWSSHNFFQGLPQLLPVAQAVPEIGDPYQSTKRYQDFLRSWAGGSFMF